MIVQGNDVDSSDLDINTMLEEIEENLNLGILHFSIFLKTRGVYFPEKSSHSPFFPEVRYTFV